MAEKNVHSCNGIGRSSLNALLDLNWNCHRLAPRQGAAAHQRLATHIAGFGNTLQLHRTRSLIRRSAWAPLNRTVLGSNHAVQCLMRCGGLGGSIVLFAPAMLEATDRIQYCRLRRSDDKRPQLTTPRLLMLQSPVTIPIAFVHGILSGVRARGQPCDAFLADAGIASELLQQVNARVSVDQYVGLYRLLIQRLDDDFLGFFSRPLRRGSFALIARSGVSATTLEVAIGRIARTFGLLQDDVVLETVHDGELTGLTLRFTNPRLERPHFLHELLLRVSWRLLAWLVGGRLPAIRFDFAFRCPPYADSYAKVFPSPRQFDTDQSTLWFDSTHLQAIVRRDEGALQAFLANAQAHVIAPRRSNDSISARVRCHLQKTQPAWSDLAATADALHMAKSTLQRQLASDGSSFQALKDELRRDCAIVRLTTSQVPLARLACELGFADSAAFQRAFKNWTGSAPGTYRRS